MDPLGHQSEQSVSFRFVFRKDVISLFRLLPNGLSLRLQLTHADDKVRLQKSQNALAGTDYKTEITELVLLVERVEPKPAVVDAVQKQLADGYVCCYPFQRVQVRGLALKTKN